MRFKKFGNTQVYKKKWDAPIAPPSATLIQGLLKKVQPQAGLLIPVPKQISLPRAGRMWANSLLPGCDAV